MSVVIGGSNGGVRKTYGGCTAIPLSAGTGFFESPKTSFTVGCSYATGAIENGPQAHRILHR